MKFRKIIYYILVMGVLISAFFISRLIIEDDKDILILTDNNPIKELPVNPPEMKDPESIPCVYSLWRENSSCQSTEELLEQKEKRKGLFTIRYATFGNYKDAEFHIKKLKQLEELRSMRLTIETIKQEKTIRVKKGDTLSKLAQIYKVSVKELTIKNSIKDPRKIILNQKLTIPLNDKYRIISMNIDGYKRAKKICDLLIDNQFTCLIKAQ
ncbi:MAG: hypothetical protein CML97_04150 [Rhodobiaceae bacterium]|nr:hypothetical protein [Rhodobiaceae bacterium]|tara:strand:+ start:354 stop:986 length:633 start_codon:yes stop_codon:yes gene_type:complete